MQTPFRNDVDALKTRLASLDDELASLRARAREYEAVQERLASVEKEHEGIRKEIDARSVKRPAPFLDTLRVASPCHERWDDMAGDQRSRHCGKCDKSVHNISEMTRAEAEAFLESVASSVCIRMYKRADGTLLTADCPVGARKKRVKRLVLATIGGGLAAAAGALAFWRLDEVTTGHALQGEMLVAPMMGTATAEPPSAPTPSSTFATPPDGTHPVMGKMMPGKPILPVAPPHPAGKAVPRPGASTPAALPNPRAHQDPSP